MYCKGDSTGSASVTAIGGSESYSYLWNNSQTTSTVTGLIAGTYTVTITDNNGCIIPIIKSVTITEPELILNANITSQTNVYCKGDSTGSATITATGGSGAYSYLWNNSQTTSTATGLIAGTYTVTVTDNNGCTIPIIKTVTITEPTIILNANITSQTNVYCKGGSTGSATVTATGGSGAYSYLWNNSQTTSAATGLIAGTYTVTLTDNNGCTIPVLKSVTITEPELILNANITSQTNVYCKGGSTGSATVTATGGSGVYLYSWNTIPVQTTATASALTSGSYNITVTDNNGCTEPYIIEIFITEPSIELSASITSQTNILCKGDSTGSATVIAAGGSGIYSYSWNTIPIQTTASLSNLPAGTYTVTVTDRNGCTVPATTEVIITEPGSALSATTSQNNVLCNGGNTGSANVIVSGGNGNYTYSWNTTPVQTTAIASNLSVGSYSVTITENNGCPVPLHAEVTITEPALPLGISTSKTNVFCKDGNTGEASVIATGGTGFYSYLWSTNPVEITDSIGNLTAGSYTIIVRDKNGCTIPEISVVNILEPDLALGASISKVDVSCNGGTTGSAMVTATGGSLNYSYLWNTTPVQTTATASNLTAGSYTVTVADNNGCTISVNSVATINEPEILSSALISSPSTCATANGKIDLTISGGTKPYNYSWSNGSTDADLSGLVSGVYTVDVTDANNCKINNSVKIGQDTLSLKLISPVYVANYNLSANQSSDGSIDLTVNGGASPYIYYWSNKATTENISNLQAGTYTVSVTDSLGCIAVGSITLIEPMALEMPTGISPNSDGLNDNFVVHGLDLFPINHLAIYNRWGDIVYQISNYKNDWNGTDGGGMALADGTYFVILEISSKGIILKGYVDIRRY